MLVGDAIRRAKGATTPWPSGAGDGNGEQIRHKGPAARRIAFIALAVAIAVAGLLAVVGLITGDVSDGLVDAWAATGAIIGFSLLALIGTYRQERRPDSLLPKLSVAAAAFGLATALTVIWLSSSDGVAKLSIIGLIVAFATSHASLLEARRRPTDTSLVCGLVTATLGFVALAALLLCITVATIEDTGPGFGRLVAIVLVLDVMLNALVPIVRRVTLTTR
jgi:hypothetical protein